MKKEELRHDPVRENIVKGVQYFSENTGTVLQVFAAIAIAVGGLSYYNHTGNIKMKMHHIWRDELKTPLLMAI